MFLQKGICSTFFAEAHVLSLVQQVDSLQKQMLSSVTSVLCQRQTTIVQEIPLPVGRFTRTSFLLTKCKISSSCLGLKLSITHLDRYFGKHLLRLRRVPTSLILARLQIQLSRLIMWSQLVAEQSDWLCQHSGSANEYLSKVTRHFFHPNCIIDHLAHETNIQPVRIGYVTFNNWASSWW